METVSRIPRSTPMSLCVALIAVVALAASMLPAGPGHARSASNPGIDNACPVAAQQLDRFADVAVDGVHREAINCITFYPIASGRVGVDDERVFAPGSPVTRAQMATFVARAIELVLEEELEATETFPDIAGVHQANIEKLATLGVVSGRGDGTFGPNLAVTRGQMATFIIGALEEILGEQLPTEARFPDVDGVHRTNIEKLTAIGVTAGRPDGTFGPQLDVTRAQMATFLARSLEFLTERDAFPDLVPPVSGVPTTEAQSRDAEEPGLLGVTDVRFSRNVGFDRVVFDIEGDGDVGWFVQYGPAVEQGTGDPVEVDGEVTLVVALRNIALPPDLPEEIELWDEERIATPEGEVIREIVDDTIFEGQHVVFLGATDEQPFLVERLEDPQRVVVDVFHG